MFDFPAAPTLNDEFTAAGITYVWNGQGWTIKPTAAAGVGDAYTKAESDAIEAAQDAKNLTDFVNVTGDTMTGDLTVRTGVAPSVYLDLATDADLAQFGISMASKMRWAVCNERIAETGGDIGTDFAISRFTDAGVFNGIPFHIRRDTGEVGVSFSLRVSGNTTLLGAVQVMGVLTTDGIVNHNAPVNFNTAGWTYSIIQTPTSWNFETGAGLGVYLQPAGAAWVAYSDARLSWKVDAAPINDALSRLADVQLYHNVTPSGRDEVFFKAQELATLLPELVIEGSGTQARDANYVPTGIGDPNAWGVMYDRCGAVALQAIKELLARIEALEARLPQPK